MTDTRTRRAALLADAVHRLTVAGVDQAEREARWIWEKVTGATPTDSALYPDELSTRSRSAWQAALDRRCAGEPLAYVLGEVAFRRLTLKSDSRALIPRPETEGLVDLVLARCASGRVLDVGTGSGCIALSLASEGNYELVVAVEQSPTALALARENVQHTGEPVALVRGDLASIVAPGAFDVLVSNPPYLSDGEYDALDPSVKNWEPSSALASGPRGLEVTARLLEDGLRVVRPGGWIALELDCSRAEPAAQCARGAGWADVSLRDDLFGRARYLLARRSDRF